MFFYSIKFKVSRKYSLLTNTVSNCAPSNLKIFLKKYSRYSFTMYFPLTLLLKGLL